MSPNRIRSLQLIWTAAALRGFALSRPRFAARATRAGAIGDPTRMMVDCCSKRLEVAACTAAVAAMLDIVSIGLQNCPLIGVQF
jgi:hypothetical protein